MAKSKLKPTANFGWMPKSIICDPNLSAKAKFVWLYINSKPLGWDFCASRMSEEMKEGRDSILRSLKELEKAGLLVRSRNSDGHYEYFLYEKPQSEKASVGKVHRGYSRLINKKDIEIKKNITNKDISISNDIDIGDSAKTTYGNQDINQCFEVWKETIGLEISGRVTANRRACYNLVRKYQVDGVTRLIRAVEKANEDKYAPRVSDFVELQSKLNALLMWAKKQTITQKTQSRVATLDDLGEEDGIRSY